MTVPAPTPRPRVPPPVPPVVRNIRRDNDMIAVLLAAVILGMTCSILLQLTSSLFTFGQVPVSVGEVVFDQSNLSGDRVLTEGQLYYPDNDRVVKYKKSSRFRFDKVSVRFSDQVVADLSGSIYYSLPRDKNQLQILFNFYGSQRVLEDRMMESVIADAATLAAKNMTSEEVQTGRYQEFLERIIEQIRNGGYNPSLFNACGFALDAIYITDISYHH